MNQGLLSLYLIGAMALLPLSAQAQSGRQGDPNLGHFYMARQQVQIIDESPMVQYQPASPAAAAQQGNGALPAGPMPLPKAGWQPYSSSLPSGMGSSLPKVVNGVPPKAPPVKNVSPMKGKAGQYKFKTPAATVPSGPKSYTPYKGYGGAPPVQATGSGSSSSSSTKVQGNVLHWSRVKRGSY